MFLKPHLLCLLLPLIVSFTQSDRDEYCLSKEEKQLYALINDYRKKQKLPPIALSASLSKVARIHATDLQVNAPHTKTGCNLHSWSEKGAWESCCYTADHKKASCMWNKPRELSNYKGDGYEICYASSNPTDLYHVIDPSNAIEAWRSSKFHNEVIINKGIWKEVKWQAVGVGVYKGFATIWFGKEKDMLPAPVGCD